VIRRLPLLLLGLLALQPSQAKKPLPLTLGVQVEWERERTGRESRRLDMQEMVREEFEEEGCFRTVTESPEEADLRLVVKLREFSISQGSGGASRIDDQSGQTVAGRSYECRIDLLFGLLPPGGEEALHADDFLIVDREVTTSNPLWDPRYQAEQRAKTMVARELRRRVCRRAPRLLEELARLEKAESVPSR
jgi:hypothetical protein